MKYIVPENAFSGSRFGLYQKPIVYEEEVSAKCAEENREGVC